MLELWGVKSLSLQLELLKLAENYLDKSFLCVTAGGPAEKCGQLKVKDEIISVNGVDFTNMRHYEAWNHLKFLDDGEIRLRIRREQS